MKFSNFYFLAALSVVCFNQENAHASAYSSEKIVEVMGEYDLDWGAAESLLRSGVLSTFENDTSLSVTPSTTFESSFDVARRLQEEEKRAEKERQEKASRDYISRLQEKEKRSEKERAERERQEKASRDYIHRLQEKEKRSEKERAERERQEKASRDYIRRLQEKEKRSEKEHQEAMSRDYIRRFYEEEDSSSTEFSSELPALGMEELREIARKNLGKGTFEFIVDGKLYTPKKFLESYPEPTVTAMGTGCMQFNKRDGHFYFPGEVTWGSGSCSMEFMYDTGATDTSISQSTALKFFGVEIKDEDFNITVSTANGDVGGARFFLPKLIIGNGENGFTFENVPLIIVQDALDSDSSLDVPLFGASLSDLLKVISIGSKMTFETP